MSENQITPEENLPGKEPGPISQTPATGSSTNQPQQTMEVHHHGHVPEKNKWKEYVFQFLMLFLAVFLGFLAENLREKGVEKDMEKEYMESLIVDLKNDSALVSETSTQIFNQVKMIDSLQGLFSSKMTKSSADIQSSYELSSFLATIYPVHFNQRTILQLISSGNMRLIKKNGVADSILAYYNYIKFVEEQKEMYKYYMNKCMESMYNVYDIDSVRSKFKMGSDSIFLKPPKNPGRPFLTSEPAEIKKLSAIMETAKASAFNFGLLLINNIRVMSTNLSNFLEKTYHIKHSVPAEDK